MKTANSSIFNITRNHCLHLCIALVLGLMVIIPQSTADDAGSSPPQKPDPLDIVYCEYMPFYFQGADGTPRGILVDFWQLWSYKTGIPVRFHIMNWAESMEAVKTGRADINAGIYHSDEREMDFDFSAPFYNLSIHIFYALHVPPPSSIADLAGMRVGVVAADYNAQPVYREVGFANLITYSEYEELVLAAISGAVDAFLMESPVAMTYLAKHNGLNIIKKVIQPLYTKQFQAAVRKGRTNILDDVNRGLRAITDAEKEAIVLNWTGERKTNLRKSEIRKVVIANSIDNMPFHFVDDDQQAVGMLVDLWKLWSRKTGIAVEFRSAPWSDSLAMVRDGRADIHAGCFYSEQRDTYLDYAGSLKDCVTHFFFHESIFGLKNLEDLIGFKIGILKRDYAVEFVNRKLPAAAIVEYPSHQALFDAVEREEVRVFICDTPTALYFLAEKQLLHAYRYHPARPLYSKAFYAAVKEGNSDLVAIINKGLQVITPKERADIERKWMGISDVKTKDVLVIATAKDFPPFSMLNSEGKPAGLFVDLWRVWAEKTGNKIEFRVYNWDDTLSAVREGTADIHAGLPATADRREWMDFSEPFYRFSWHIYYRDKSINPTKLEDLKGYPIGVEKGSFTADLLNKRFPHNSISEHNSTEALVLAAAGERIKSFPAIPASMSILLSRHGLMGEFRKWPEVMSIKPVHAAVRKNRPDLLAAIDAGFQSISKSDMQEIENRWITNEKDRYYQNADSHIELTTSEEEWLRTHKTIRLGVDRDRPPFEFMDEDDIYMGMVSDYVRLLNERLGLNMVVASGLNRSAFISKTQAEFSDIDVFPCVVPTVGRQAHISFTAPYISFPSVIITHRQAPLIGGLRDLYGKKAAVVRGYAIAEQLQKDHPMIHLEPVDSVNDGLKAVSEGMVEAYVGNLAAAGYRIQENNYTNLKVAASTDYGSEGFAFGIRKNWPELVSILDKGIASIKTVEHDSIRQKWFSVRFDRRITAQDLRRLSLQISGAGALIFGVIFFWHRQIRRREERFRGLTEHGTDIILAFQPDGTIVYQSPSNTTVLGYGRKELIHRSILSLLHEQDLESWRRMLMDLPPEGGAISIVHRLRHKEGNFRYFESNCVDLTHNKSLKAIVINARDLTDRIRADKEMKKAKEAAELANRSKSEFLAGLSHEIRTPLNAIVGMTDITLRSELQPEQTRNLRAVKDSAKHLLEVISDILDLSAIEAGKMRVERIGFDLERLLNRILRIYRRQAEQKGLQLDLIKSPEVPRFIKGDPVRLRQILVNLLGNALKFTPKGKIKLTLRIPDINELEESMKTEDVNLSPDSNRILYSVEDTGIGIPRDKQKHIFDSFTQAEGSTTRKYGGTGLGLSICKNFAGLMGGTIWVDSALGKGSSFHVLLPCEPAEPPTGREAAEITDLKEWPTVMDNVGPLRILLAEDCPVNATVADKYIEELGHQVVKVENGRQVVSRLSQDQFDMVLMDIEMPETDGLSASRQIREGLAGKDNRDIPIIAMTAHVLPEFKQKSAEAGMNAFLAKPVELDDLKQMIERTLNNKEHDMTSSDGNYGQSLMPAFDLGEVLNRFGGDRELVDEVFRIVINETPAVVHNLETALEARDRGQIYFAAHTLKGAAARIGATACMNTALALETSAKKAPEPIVKVLADRCIGEWSHLITILEQDLALNKETG